MRAMTEADFWSRILPPDENGCRRWKPQYYRDRDGYVPIHWRARFGDHPIPAHRAAWILRHGPIPKGKVILHTCDVPDCMTDAHHRLGTQADNQRDMSQKGRNHNSNKTHCPYGHPYTYENTYIRKDGQRACRLCRGYRSTTLARKQRRNGRKYPVITQCPHGHQYTPENSYYDPRGNRRCRQCMRNQNADRK